MRVKVNGKHYPWKDGEILEVVEHPQNNKLYESKGYVISKSDCTIIPDEPGNRVQFDYEQWKEKGGRAWDCDNDEVTQIVEFDLGVVRQYAGVVNGQLLTFASDELTMSAPDEVYYVNYGESGILGSHKSIKECELYRLPIDKHILEINITKGTNKIVHTYKTEP